MSEISIKEINFSREPIIYFGNINMKRSADRCLIDRRMWVTFPRLKHLQFMIEVNLLNASNSLSVWLNVGGVDNKACVFVAIPFICCIAFILDWHGSCRWLPRERKTTGFSIAPDWAMMSIWHDDSGWTKDRFKWQHVSFSPSDVLFGVNKYSERDIEIATRAVEIDGVEHVLDIKLFESTFKRPRWPWAKKVVRADITPRVPITIPGKGENSWDCGDDAIHSLMTPCDSVDEAVVKFVADVLGARKRR